MKLKTLKDTKIEGKTTYGDWLFSYDELKAEAIKDIKFFEDVTINEMEKLGWADWGIKEYIKWKNNLTEEDLKE